MPMPPQLYHPDVQRRVRQAIRARKNARRRRLRLERRGEAIATEIDLAKEEEADFEEQICADLRVIGPTRIGDHVYYTAERTAPDGSPYWQLYVGNPDSAEDREAIERINADLERTHP